MTAAPDQVATMPRELLKRSISFVNGKDGKSVSIDCSVKDCFEVVVVGLVVRMKWLAIMG